MARVRREVARALDREAVLEPGERVLVACSGGADSSAMLDVLVQLGPPRALEIEVVHVDHGLRPGSGADAAVVEALARARAVPCHLERIAVAPGGSLQNRARVARHGALRRLAERRGATAIALGHTADDQAETVLMRALSGATPRSLTAMSPRHGRLARPLLRLWRRQTLEYCAALGIEPLDDPANHDPRHLRTRVREELLPALERVFPAARRRLCVLAERQRAELLRDRDGDARARGGSRNGS